MKRSTDKERATRTVMGLTAAALDEARRIEWTEPERAAELRGNAARMWADHYAVFPLR